MTGLKIVRFEIWIFLYQLNFMHIHMLQNIHLYFPVEENWKNISHVKIKSELFPLWILMVSVGYVIRGIQIYFSFIPLPISVNTCPGTSLWQRISKTLKKKILTTWRRNSVKKKTRFPHNYFVIRITVCTNRKSISIDIHEDKRKKIRVLLKIMKSKK